MRRQDRQSGEGHELTLRTTSVVSPIHRPSKPMIVWLSFGSGDAVHRSVQGNTPLVIDGAGPAPSLNRNGRRTRDSVVTPWL